MIFTVPVVFIIWKFDFVKKINPFNWSNKPTKETEQPGPNVIKLFTDVIYGCS
jgi:hypothetical protein